MERPENHGTKNFRIEIEPEYVPTREMLEIDDSFRVEVIF